MKAAETDKVLVGASLLAKAVYQQTSHLGSFPRSAWECLNGRSAFGFERDAERPGLNSHAERGNDQSECLESAITLQMLAHFCGRDFLQFAQQVVIQLAHPVLAAQLFRQMRHQIGRHLGVGHGPVSLAGMR